MAVNFSGSLVITGSITTTGVITMSGSIASASYSSTSDLLQGTGSVGFVTTASFNAVSSSQQQISASLLNVISIFATTGSNSFRADQSITGSLVVSSTITAQTLVVQTITSSIVNITGSNIFGSQLSDRQTFTGSVVMTGSLIVNTTGPELQVNNNGVILGNLPTDRHGVTGSFYQTGSIAGFSNCVGIGTNIPTYRLDIQNPADFDIRLRDNSLGGTVGILFETANDFSGTSQAYIKGVGAGNSGLSDLILGTSCAVGATSAIERMRITSGGNVGIGTCSPSQRLEVVGGEIKAGRVDSTNEGGQLSFGRALDNNTSWYIDAYGSAASPQLRFVNVDNAVVAMTITGSSLGIGTSTPTTGTKLDVVGTIGNFQIGTSGAEIFLTRNENNDILATGGTSSGITIGAQNYVRFSVGTSYTERMRITACGTVKTQNNQALGALETSGTIANNNCITLNLNSAGGNASIGFIAIGASRTDTTACHAVRLYSQSHTNGFNTYTSIQGTNDGGITITNNANGSETIYNCSGATVNYVVRYINLISINSIFERQ